MNEDQIKIIQLIINEAWPTLMQSIKEKGKVMIMINIETVTIKILLNCPVGLKQN